MGAGALLCVWVGVSACQPTEAPPPESTQAPTPTVSPAFDVGAVMRRAGLAFRAGKERFTAGQGTWRVQVDPQGNARFEPLLWPEPPPAAAGERARPELERASTQAVTGAPLGVRTASVARGGRALLQGLAASVREDGALALARGPVVEVLRAAEEGVEQRWELESRPEGQGDLEVRVALSGLEYAGQTEHGHHFRDAKTGLGVRYGRATWVDAAGVKTAVETVREGAELVMRVPQAVLERSSWPAVLDPVISPEMGIDTPLPQPTREVEILPAVAYGGGVYLVAWMHGSSFEGYNILAARVRASDGVLLDVGGITLSSAPGDQYYPAVASSGSEFLVVWSRGPGLVSTRVRASDGRVLDSTPRLVAASPADGVQTAVAFDGTNYFVAWSDNRSVSGSDIYGARVRASDGVALDGSGIPLCVQPGNQGGPAVAFDGTRYLVVWDDSRNGVDQDLYGTRVRPSDAAVLDPNGFVIAMVPRIQWGAAVSFDGTQFLVAWEDLRNSSDSTNYDVYGARVRGADGAVLDPAGIPIATGTASQGAVSVPSSGGGSLVVWQHRESSSVYDVYTARVGSDGAVSQVRPFSAAATTEERERVPVVATDGTDYLVVWEDSNSGLDDIHAARLRGSDGTVLDPQGRLVSTDANSQDGPVVAQGGDTYFVAWKDGRNPGNGWDLYGARVRASDGALLDGSAIPLAVSVHADELPRVASDGRDFLLAWSPYDFNRGNSDVMAVRVSGSEGRVLDATPIRLATTSANQSVTSVSYGGGYYLVTWRDSGSDTGNILAARVRASDGQVMEPGGFLVSNAAGGQEAADAAYGEGVFLVAWTDGRVGNTAAESEVYGARVRASDGALLDDVSTGRPLAQAARNQFAPRVAFDGTQFMVAWADVRSGNVDILGTRVRASDGAVLDPAGLGLHTLPGTQTLPAMAFDGRHHLLIWTDSSTSPTRLRGTRLTPAGVPVDGTGFDLGNPTNASVSVAAWGPGRALVAYSGRGPGARQARVQVRLVSDPANGSRCTDGGQCDSGFCADGVCCDSACGGGVAEDCQACGVAAGGAVDGTCGLIPASAARVCRTSGGACDVAEQCDGASPECPVDVGAPDGTACDDGSACTRTDACQSGVCAGAEPVVCTAPNPCMRAGACDPATGVCSAPEPMADGTACDDGNACTQTDTCQAGTCTGASPVVCAGGDACNTAGTCNPATGQCSAPVPVADGTACNDGNACTQTDTCTAGACGGSNPVVCAAGDACHVAGTCNPETGQCSAPAPAPNGTACDDGNACTRSDSCQAGACTGANPVTCTAGDACHVAGTCNPATGACSEPVPAPNGTSCDDGNACTRSDTCQAGACAGADPVVCTAGDACHVAGTCNPATGVCSAQQPAPNGTSCDDGNACTRSDACEAGACTGANPVTCTASDVCHVAGTCNPSTGVCTDPEAEDGTTCPEGACQAGTCVPTPDAGTPDAGSEPDAGGEPDAGSGPDAGQTADAGDSSDAGSEPDAGGSADAGSGPSRPLPAHDPMGCGCGVPAGSADMGLLMLIAGAALLRRSRRQRP